MAIKTKKKKKTYTEGFYLVINKISSSFAVAAIHQKENIIATSS